MASKRRCILCDKQYTRSKGRHFGTFFCSDRCRWESRKVPIDVVYKRDDAICHLCGNYVPREEASRDHVKPKSKGGKWSFDNIRLSHGSCNSRRGSRPVKEFQEILERALAGIGSKEMPVNRVHL